MNIGSIFKTVTRFTSEHSPTILTVLGSAGVVTTAVMAVRVTPKAHAIIQEDEATGGVSDSSFENAKRRVRLTWKLYLPSVLSGATAIACVISANSINLRRNAAVASVLTLTTNELKEYQAKVVEAIGERKNKVIREELIQDKVKSDPVANKEIYIVDKKEQLFYDTFSGRYFTSDMETVRAAVNNVNQEVLINGYASQNYFYGWLGLRNASIGEEVGWNTENLLDIEFGAVLTEDGRPCIGINYRIQPRYRYDRFS